MQGEEHCEQRSVAAELVGFMREDKAWWIVPTLAVLARAGLLVVLIATAAPFLYMLWP